MKRILITILLLSTYLVKSQISIDPNEVLYPPLCHGDANGSISIDISGGNLLSYFWLSGTGTADSIYGLAEGIYTLVVIDSLVTDTFIFTLVSPPILELDLTIIDSILPCFGALTVMDVLISGGSSPYSINWNDGDTSQQRVVGSGYYELETTDANGCVSNDSILITEPDSLHISVAYSDMGCNLGASATVTINGGVPPISYLWNTGDTIATIDSLLEFTYWVVVTESCGTSLTDTIYLNYYELNTVVYYNDSTHTAKVEIESASSGPFEHIWLDVFNDSIGFGQVSPILCEGTYFVITTDLFNNCSIIDTVLVEFDIPLGIFDINLTTVYPDSNLWGFAPYTYLWSNGDDSAYANICPGDHWVEVTDINGCLIREDFIIDNLIISLDPASAIIECNLENVDIDLEASVTGGTGPYLFEWWNGSTENPINMGISPGNFGVTVTDRNNCLEDTVFVIATITSECIPNIFTPNGDGQNETWNLENTFLYEDSEVRIYGRYGRLIFQSFGYNEAWNGTNNQGKDVPEGVYFYSIEIGHGFEPINGMVTILR
jgi:gliding motility-associated-like protein